MKTIKKFKHLLVFALGMFLLSSCQDYLDKTPSAETTEEDVFGTYSSFQGFVDGMYSEINTNVGFWTSGTMDIGGEATDLAFMSITLGGDYWRFLNWEQCPLYSWRPAYGSDNDRYEGRANRRGVWPGGWRMIRKANISLDKLPLLQEATDEERRLIEGQVLFFRGYHHGEIIAAFGGVPYIDKVFEPNDEMRESRLSYHEVTERIIEDLDKAIPLLPEDWDDTTMGKERPGAYTGRITRGMAIAYKQRFLLFAGSPLMNGTVTGNYTYHIDYMKRSAAAGWEMIQLANKGVYQLVPWELWHENFYNLERRTVWTTETILARTTYQYIGNAVFNHPLRRNYVPGYLSDITHCNTANQAFVDRFEMADGTRYKIEYDQDDDKRWENRDPRFHKTFAVDRERVGNHPNSVISLYIGDGALARPMNMLATGILIKKFWPYNVNKWDGRNNNHRFIIPRMLFAEVYLSYAEAVTVAYGPDGKAPGADLTAVDAINIVRARAGMPPVTSAAEGYDSFLELVWNERCVELAYGGGHYWYDKRRWYIGHLEEHKQVVDLEFDKDWTYFNRTLKQAIVFDQKHYWMPLPRNQVYLYEELPQNPGW